MLIFEPASSNHAGIDPGEDLPGDDVQPKAAVKAVAVNIPTLYDRSVDFIARLIIKVLRVFKLMWYWTSEASKASSTDPPAPIVSPMEGIIFTVLLVICILASATLLYSGLLGLLPADSATLEIGNYSVDLALVSAIFFSTVIVAAGIFRDKLNRDDSNRRLRQAISVFVLVLALASACVAIDRQYLLDSGSLQSASIVQYLIVGVLTVSSELGILIIAGSAVSNLLIPFGNLLIWFVCTHAFCLTFISRSAVTIVAFAGLAIALAILVIVFLILRLPSFFWSITLQVLNFLTNPRNETPVDTHNRRLEQRGRRQELERVKHAEWLERKKREAEKNLYKALRKRVTTPPRQPNEGED